PPEHEPRPQCGRIPAYAQPGWQALMIRKWQRVCAVLAGRGRIGRGQYLAPKARPAWLEQRVGRLPRPQALLPALAWAQAAEPLANSRHASAAAARHLRRAMMPVPAPMPPAWLQAD